MDTQITTHQDSAIEVSDNAKRYASKSRSENTVRIYRSFWREFKSFAERRGEISLPASPATVIEYLTKLADGGAKLNTIEVKLAAVAFAHRNVGAADPTVYDACKVVMSGIRREVGRSPNKKEPATLEQITAMLATIPTDTIRGKRDRALLLVGFAGAFRRSELVALNVADIRLNGSLRIIVRSSKTDQTSEGMTKTIPAIGGELCPVQAMRDYLDSGGVASGPVFRRVRRGDHITGDRLTSQTVALVVKAAARAAGLDWRQFSGHSLRSGFITQAMDAGAADSDIMEQTGHTSVQTMRGYRKGSGVGASRAVVAAFGGGGDD